MFTGLITDIGIIKSINHENDLEIEVQTNYDLETIKIGASIAHDGVCLTVTKKKSNSYFVTLSSETINLTTAKNWQIDRKINLEESLKLGDELGGHLVSGHVDGIGQVVNICELGQSWEFEIKANNELLPFIAKKGSVTINGVSLTVNDVYKDYFKLCIIPHTFENTNFQYLNKNDIVNIEIDIIARYIKRIGGFNAGND